MTDFIMMSCPSCGHKLQIEKGIDRFICAACGNQNIVNRNEGIFTIEPVIEDITEVQAGVDRTQSELAILRLQTEIEDLKSKIKVIQGSKSVGERGILEAGFFILLAMILLAFNSTRLAGLFIIVVTVLIYILSQRETTKDKEIDNELKNLLNELAMKEKELQNCPAPNSCTTF